MPAILLATSSTRIEVSSAIFTDGVYVDKLFSFDLHTSFHSARLVVRLARAMAAIKLCATELRGFYHDLDLEKPVDPNKSFLFPAPIPSPPPRPGEPSRLPQLTFLAKLSRSNGAPVSHFYAENYSHGLFLAEDRVSKEEVVVKFTTQYNERAHRLLAEAEPKALAPALRACVPVVGDVYMVIMEHIKGENLWHEQKPYPRYALEDVRKAINLLGLVFGDLRDTNVVLVPEEKRAVLVDFDRCDVHDQGHYPPLVNESVYGADSGIDGGGVMLKEHDMIQLSRMTEHFQVQAD